MRETSIALLLAIFCPAVIVADDPAGITFFEKKIRPVLAEHCYKCHSGKKLRGGLAIDSKEGLLKGGDSGPAVVAGKPGESLLVKALGYGDQDLQMPPNGKLPAHVIADFHKWIALGAPDPRTAKNVAKKDYEIDIEEGRKFWAFQLPKKHPLPKVKNQAWAYGDIDRFILASLESKGLKPVDDADKVTLIRRAYFALIGMPPSPKQIDDFVNDDSPQAFAKVIDELLASPHFGERWARHWLDVARYAESTGGGRSMLLPDAWRYRDYVIHVFNTDKSFRQFILEQIAGDLLKYEDDDERYWQLVATAFLLLGPTNYELQDKPVLEMDVIDEQLDTIGRSFLGMTIGCARCHDHKFDPIPTTDYYALAGIFKSTKSLVHANVSRWMEVPMPMPPEKELAFKKHQVQVAALKATIKKSQAELKKTRAELGVVTVAQGPVAVKDLPGIVIDDTEAKKIGSWSKSTFKNTFVGDGYVYSSRGNSTITYNPKIPKDGFYEVRLAYLPNPNRATNTPVYILYTDGEKTVRIDQRRVPPIEGRWISLGKYRFEKGDQWFVMLSTQGAKGGVVVADAVQFIHEDELDSADVPKAPVATSPNSKAERLVQKLEAELNQMRRQLKKLEAKGPKRPKIMAVQDHAKVNDLHVCIRGQLRNKGPVVKRGFLQVATIGPMPEIPSDESGRLQLARWLASENNPLTARVVVNRIWHHLFGQGIVRTVDNFGSTGSQPSHPELLDHLAVRFVEQGWSVKKLIREIMLSHAWQLSSKVDKNDPSIQRAIKVDPENQLLWRQNRRRLEAECIRDAILLVSGQIDMKLGGPNIKKGTTVERDYKFTSTRRSVYTPIFRNQLMELFAVFDFPDPNLVSGKRAASTVAPQALYLMNSPFAIEQGRAAAKKLLAVPDLSNTERIQLAYRTALGRLPTEQEQELALGFVSRGNGNDSAPPEAAWAQFYQVLFACIDFRYVN